MNYMGLNKVFFNEITNFLSEVMKFEQFSDDDCIFRKKYIYGSLF